VVKVLIYILMLFLFSTTVLSRHLWQLKAVVFLPWCIIRAVLLLASLHLHLAPTPSIGGNITGSDISIMCQLNAGNTKGGSIIVLLTSCLIGLDYSVLQIKTKIVSSHTADSKPVNQEVNCTVILPPLVFPG